eukprot:TRINITY_DN5487_c0_g2_i1.p1 TRINITY_DN5487_c0_g2~~TRINITY_DN5487_c0_g2_i1.p1  ORF type:complete len:143 (+),score=18.40 TRINITY_DN5487_c0_g2_i1:497-925(+)
MTIAFMALFCCLISDKISVNAGLTLLLPLIFIGGYTVVYWINSELLGEGDLRYYILVQLLPFLSVPYIMLLWPDRYTESQSIYVVLSLYILAKVVEHFDEEIYMITWGIISGHTIKHLLVSYAMYVGIRMIRYRKKVAEKED